MNSSRKSLHEILPLETPLSVHIFPSFYCNFKCNYCLHALPPEKLEQMRFKKQFMDFSLYRKAIDDLTDFPNKLEALIFAGHGEPLVHKQIAEMVQYAKERDVAKRIEIVTNGSLLTKKMSEELIAAGLDRLRISLQGVTEEKYREISGVDLDFGQFVEGIRYFYEHKVSTEVFIKIVDLALKDEQEAEKFRTIFSAVSDQVSIEHVYPFIQEIDYTRLGELSGKCKQDDASPSSICSMPFYMMVLYPDGNVTPCCSPEIPFLYGNVKEHSMIELWNVDQRREFLLRHLNGHKSLDVCEHCTVPGYGLQKGDYLDGYEEKLRIKYQMQEERKCCYGCGSSSGI